MVKTTHGPGAFDTTVRAEIRPTLQPMNWNDIIRLATHGVPAPPRRVEKTKEEWKAQLTPMQYHVTREHGTERAFTGEYCEAHDPGLYACVC